MISVSVHDEEGKWRAFTTAKPYGWPQSFDRESKIARAFDVTRFPTYILIDPEGIVRLRVSGTTLSVKTCQRSNPQANKDDRESPTEFLPVKSPAGLRLLVSGGFLLSYNYNCKRSRLHSARRSAAGLGWRRLCILRRGQKYFFVFGSKAIVFALGCVVTAPASS